MKITGRKKSRTDRETIQSDLHLNKLQWYYNGIRCLNSDLFPKIVVISEDYKGHDVRQTGHRCGHHFIIIILAEGEQDKHVIVFTGSHTDHLMVKCNSAAFITGDTYLLLTQLLLVKFTQASWNLNAFTAFQLTRMGTICFKCLLDVFTLFFFDFLIISGYRFQFLATIICKYIIAHIHMFAMTVVD